MRNGFLLALLVSTVVGGTALAQPGAYYPQPYPTMPPGYGSPQVFIGGALQADGPIPLPNPNAPPRPLASYPTAMYPAPPANMAPPYASPQAPPGVSTTKPAIQPTGGSLPAPASAASPIPPAAAAPAPLQDVAGATVEACAPVHVPEASHDPRLPEFPHGAPFYGATDVLYWWTRPQQAPPLLVAGLPGSNTVLVGGGNLGFDDGEHVGVRTSIGAWLNECQTCGVEAGFLWLFQRSPHTTVTVPDGSFLTRPFTDATTGLPSGIILTNPGISTGVSTVSTTSRLWSAEANARMELWRFDYGHIDLLAGFRYFDLDESLTISDFVRFQAVPVFLSDATVITRDFFGTRNNFYGGQIGLESQVQFGCWYIDLWGKVALGAMHEVAQIDGSTLIFAPPAPVGNVAAVGGILAQPTNIGTHNLDRFAAIPEVGVKLGCRLNEHLRVNVGYSFLYLNRVARPGDQIDTVVNPTQIPQLFQGPLVGPARPMFQFHESEYWAHGISLEFEYRF